LFSRVCTKCHTNESIFKKTIHEDSKVPINKAFYIIYKVFNNLGKITGRELEEKINLPLQTCNAYKKKVLEKLEEKQKSGSKIKGWQELILD
jgi:two-component system, sensor histidine kinase LadS